MEMISVVWTPDQQRTASALRGTGGTLEIPR
jgi:hypothetical protein